MQLLLYVLLYPLLWFISKLPFSVLYLLSDFCFVVVYRLIGYRKKTVRENLRLALPHLSDSERLVIEKKSYRHLCDMFLEMIKTMSITRKEIDERFVFTNMQLYLDMEKQQKSIALMVAHYASYEWVISMNRISTFTGYAIYKRVANKYFDNLVHRIRSRFKAELISTKETIPTLAHNQAIGKLGVYGFASDQSPKAEKAVHWTRFMGIDTPVHTGAEMLAKHYDLNLIFLRVEKVRRGHYEATFEPLADDPRQVPDYEITDLFIKKVEQQIYNAPEYYLWTHKRWKHRR